MPILPDSDQPTTSLNGVVTSVAASIEGNTVLLELICSDEYAAQVVHEDVVARLNSDIGLRMTLRVKPAEVTKVTDA